MSGAPFDVESMIAAGRADAPGEATRARLLAGLRPRLKVPAWHAPAALAAAAAVLLAAALLFRQLSSVEATLAPVEAPAMHVEASPVALPPEPAPVAPPAVEAVPVPPAPARKTVTTRPAPAAARADEAPPKPAPVSSLAEEARLLRQAQRALDQADAKTAHGALSEHAARFPEGILAPERHAALALTACLEGQAADARREVELLVALAPQSPLLGRLKGSCAFSHETSEARPLNGTP